MRQHNGETKKFLTFEIVTKLPSKSIYTHQSTVLAFYAVENENWKHGHGWRNNFFLIVDTRYELL
jgi:hypothetical protein